MNPEYDDLQQGAERTFSKAATCGLAGTMTKSKPVSIWKLWPVWAYVLAFTVPAIVICLGFALFAR